MSIEQIICKAQDTRKATKKGPTFYKTFFPEEEPISVEEQKNIKRDLFRELLTKEFLNTKIQKRDNFSEVSFFSKIS